MARPSPGLLTALVLAFEEHGIAQRADRLRLCSDHAGRHLTSSSDLTEAEAHALLDRLKRLPRGALPAALARLVATEEAIAAAHARLHQAGQPDPRPVPPAARRTVGFMCARTGPNRGCTPITAADVEHARLAGEQMEIDDIEEKTSHG